jgi:MinD-like ATPase involved in chromosome partitioning or flagellar assembly
MPAKGAKSMFSEKAAANGPPMRFKCAPLLGQIPLDSEIREGGDRGIPVSIAYPDSPVSKAFQSMASNILKTL